ncbi:hypothetical protein AMJ80_09770 [bacterium SM23_31]|nr:MAG: hypothetical protein AMJ80_09770 [bacterium SM23_31]
MKSTSIKSFLPRSSVFLKNYLFLFCLFSLTLLCNVSAVYSQDADYYYRTGLTLKDESNIDEAIEAFKKAILKNHKFAEAYYQLALCYLRQTGSNVSLKHATDAIREALFLDRDNREYAFAFADIYAAKNNYDDAKGLIEDILRENPDDVPALKRLAGYTLKEYKSYQYQTGNVNRLFNYAESLETEVYRLYDLILKLNPYDRETLFNKALIRFDDGDLDTFIELLEKILNANENDSAQRDANLFLGLGYSEKNDYEKSFLHYNKAFSLMSPEERSVFENPEIIDAKIDVNIKGDFELILSADTLHFWDKKDPYYLTEINERKLVHYGRIAEANLRFSVSQKGIPGWRTAMGLIWIKYGKPLTIRQYNNSITFQNIQIWNYKDFSIGFYAGNNAARENNYKFELETGFFGGPRSIGSNIESKIARHPEIYEYKPRGELLQIPVNVLNYRENNKTEVKIFYGMAINKIKWKPVINRLYGEMQYGIYVHDSDWNRIIEKVDTSIHEYDKSEIDPGSMSLLVSSDKFNINPGNYSISFEVLEPNSGNAGVVRDTISIERFGYDSLQMSDILAAYNIELTDEQKPLSRDNITINGDPQHAFTKDQPIYIYYEVYNLFIMNELGENYYKVEYSFRTIDPETLSRIYLKRLIKNIPFKPREYEGVWVSSEIHGFGRTELQILQIEQNFPDIGVYELVVKITDMISGMTVIKSTPIQIYK